MKCSNYNCSTRPVLRQLGVGTLLICPVCNMIYTNAGEHIDKKDIYRYNPKPRNSGWGYDEEEINGGYYKWPIPIVMNIKAVDADAFERFVRNYPDALLDRLKEI